MKCVFDNEQVVGKTWSVRPDQTVPMSIVTTHDTIVLDDDEALQCNGSLQPSKWLFQQPTTDQREYFLYNEDHANSTYFRAGRDNLIGARFNLCTQRDVVNENIHIKQKVKENKICPNCNIEFSKQKRICSWCQSNLVELSLTNSHLLSTELTNPVKHLRWSHKDQHKHHTYMCW